MLQNIKNPHNPIGDEQIYPETHKAALEILKEFERHLVYPLLVSEPQQGKTAVQIAVADSFIRTCEANNESWQVVLITNLSDNSLRDQTKIRFRNAQLRGVEIYHHANLKKVKDKSVDKRLIILDECHYALGKGKPLDAFLLRCGVDYGRPINTWAKQNNYVLSVSATPYASVIREQLDLIYNNPTFKQIHLDQSDDYYSLGKIIESGRLVQSESLLDESGSLSPFLKGRIDAFYKDFKENPGYYIIRCQGEAYQEVKEYCKINNIVNETYSCSKKDDFPIDQLDLNISGAVPLTPTVIIIKGALRAGKTLTSTKNIRRWTESENSNADSVAQVVGRCLGYKDKTGHSKFDDTFQIDCDIEAINQAALFYGYNPTFIPKGNNNTSNVKYKMRNYESVVEIFNTKEEAVAAAKIIYGDNPLWHTKYRHPSNLSKNGVTGVNPNDVARSILNGTSPSTYEVIFHMDKTNTRFHQSCINLFEAHPEYLGKYLVLSKIEKPSKQMIMSPIQEKNIKECSLLRSDSQLPLIVPKGNYNLSNLDEEKEYEWKISSGEEWKNHSLSAGPISNNMAHDECDHILKGKVSSSRSRAFRLDAPSKSSKFDGQASWDALFQKFPDWKIGDIVYAVEKDVGIKVSNTENLFKKNCLLS